MPGDNVPGNRVPVVVMEHVYAALGGEVVLHDLSLRIEQGEQIALLGPNGCGKSTLLKVLTCELYPLIAPPSTPWSVPLKQDRSAGTPTLPRPETRIVLLGRARWDVTELRRRMGVVSAELPGKAMLATSGLDAILTGFFSSSTLWPNLVVTPAMRLRAEQILEQVGAVALRGRAVGAMSAGQQRRIMIGRALAGTTGEVQVLLLDEPSNALDLAAQADLRAMLRALAQAGTAIVLITHQVADILPDMRRVVKMKEGRIVADGAKEELLTAERLRELFGREIWLAERDGVLFAW